MEKEKRAVYSKKASVKGYGGGKEHKIKAEPPYSDSA